MAKPIRWLILYAEYIDGHLETEETFVQDKLSALEHFDYMQQALIFEHRTFEITYKDDELVEACDSKTGNKYRLALIEIY